MFDYTPTDRRLYDSFRRSRTTSGIRSFWHNQLRPTSGADTAIKDPQTPLTSPASSSGSGGITGSSAGSLINSNSARRALHKAAVTANRRRNTTEEIRDRFASLAKPLFQSYLLSEIEPHETRPALTVVFDLDETLVSNRDADISSAILRPYSLHVLNALRHFKGVEVVLWTASTKTTASPVVEQLNVSGVVFDDIIFRSNLWFTEPLHTKDLRLLGRDIDRLIIIENAANCCKLNPQNAVLVDSFHGEKDPDDAALVNVYYIIERIHKGCQENIPVQKTLQKLVEDRQLCREIEFSLPESWKSLPLREIPPLKIPPHGRFTVSNSEPLGESVMKHWTI